MTSGSKEDWTESSYYRSSNCWRKLPVPPVIPLSYRCWFSNSSSRCCRSNLTAYNSVFSSFTLFVSYSASALRCAISWFFSTSLRLAFFNFSSRMEIDAYLNYANSFIFSLKWSARASLSFASSFNASTAATMDRWKLLPTDSSSAPGSSSIPSNYLSWMISWCSILDSLLDLDSSSSIVFNF